MLKIDYILLARHFQEQTSEEENTKIISWREENIINSLTYNRLKSVSITECLPAEQQKITKEETKVWKKIITKILEEV